MTKIIIFEIGSITFRLTGLKLCDLIISTVLVTVDLSHVLILSVSINFTRGWCDVTKWPIHYQYWKVQRLFRVPQPWGTPAILQYCSHTWYVYWEYRTDNPYWFWWRSMVRHMRSNQVNTKTLWAHYLSHPTVDWSCSSRGVHFASIE